MKTGRGTGAASGVRLAVLNGSYQGLANLYYLFVRGVYVVLFARLLGIELYGHYVYSQSWYVLALPIAAWGMNELAMARYPQLDSTAKADMLAGAFFLRLVLGAIMALLIVAAALCFETSPDLRLLIIIYAQAVLVRGAINWLMSLFVMSETNQFALYLTVPFLTLEVLVAIALALWGVDLPVIALAQCSVWWLQLLVTVYICWRRFGAIKPRFSRGYSRFFIANGASLALAAFILSFLGSGLLIVYRYFAADQQQLGAAAFVIQLVLILSQVVKVTSNSALPQLNLPVVNRPQRQAFYAVTVWDQSLYIGGALFLICYLLLPPLVVGLIGGEFAVAAGIFASFSWLLIPMSIIYGLRLSLISNRQTHEFLVAISLGLLLLLIQVGVLARLEAVTLDRLLSALGIAYWLIAFLILAMVRRQLPGLARADLAIAPVVLAASLAIFFSLRGSSSGFAVSLGLLPLIIASYLGFRRARRMVADK